MKSSPLKPNTINELYPKAAPATMCGVPTKNKSVRSFLARQGRAGGRAGKGIPKQVSIHDQHAKAVLSELACGRVENAARFVGGLPAHSDYCPALRRLGCTCVIGRARRAYAKAAP